MQLCEGRPADARERLEKERRTYDLLDSLGIRYWRTDHAPAGSIAQCQDIVGKKAGILKPQFYLLMMPGDKAFKTKDLSAELGVSRLSFAKAEAMEALLDVTPGSVSIMGLMNDKGHRVQLVIDEDVLREPYIGCHPCINTSSLKIATADIMDKYLKAVGHAAKIVHLKKTEEE